MKEPSENIPSPLSFSRDSRDFLPNVRDFFYNSLKRLAKFARLERDGIRLIFLPLTK